MSSFIDISLPLAPAMVSWPTDPPFEMTSFKTLDEGSSNVSVVTTGTHTGTHVDPPLHFIRNGKGVDEIALDKLIGDCVVVSNESIQVINESTVVELLDPLPEPPRRVLFKTRSSSLWEAGQFSEDYVWLDESGVLELLGRGVELVGVDYLSVGPPHDGGEVHRLLLEAGVVVVEGLDLRRAEPGTYELICLPLRIEHGDGSPARAVLRRE